MEFENCKYAEFTNRQWFGTACTIVKCRHPDAVAAIQQYNESHRFIDVLNCGVFTNEIGKWFNENDDHMERRSMFCNKKCPGFLLKSIENQKK